ncbi:MAG: rod shape-determining protein MreD [Gammaproteobacteria bacterium]
MRRPSPWLALPLSFLLAFLLVALPLPQVLSYWRPELVTMLLVFWVLTEPGKVGVWTAFVLGLLLDVLMATTFGVYPLMLATVAYLTRLSYRWVRVLSLWQTGGLVFVLVLASLVIKRILLGVLGGGTDSLLFWAPALTSALVWPTVMLSLRRFTR